MLPSTTHFDFLAAGGEIEALIQAIDWSKTPLGPLASWPQSLKISVRIVLGSRYPMFLWWGEELTLLYNDAYARMTLASKHPWALGRSVREVWAEIWSDIEPRIDEVMHKGQATWDEELLLILERRGFREETYHTFSYSPIPDDEGGIGGIICPVTEETKQVLGQRRLRTLRELAARTSEEARTVESTCRTALQILAQNPHDLPFALIYLFDSEEKCARLAGVTGLPEDSPARPEILDLAQPNEVAWPLWATLQSMRSDVVTELGEQFGALPGNVWPEPPHTAIVLPIKQASQIDLAGFLVVGLSPRLALDDDYRGFLELTAGHIGSAIANARAYEIERQRAEALAELDRAKTTFFNNISHEFRTPLTLMLGPVEEGLAEAQVPAQRQRLELIQRNALRLQKLVNTLLDFSRIEAGRIQASYEPTDLALLTRDLASLFRSAVEKTGLRLIVDCPPLSELVYVDRDKWEQIVLNLVSNAFKFTFEGEIEVALRELTQGEKGESVQLLIRDTGSGISEEQLPHIFERFHRVEGTRARTLEGTGIGLAFVSELTRLHGGTVGVESVEGKGSTFTVTLPKGKAHLPPNQVSSGRTDLATPRQANQHVEEVLRWLPGSEVEELETPPLDDGAGTPSAVTREGLRIVLADDNADMRNYVRRLLADTYDVEAVADGVAALAAVRRNPPDLLLADMMMPGLDGFGLLQAIRSDEALKTLPVLILSARAGEEAKVEGLDAGADDYLVKPFSARELLARIGAQLELARVRREAMVALQESEERLRLAVRAGNIFTWEVDPQTRKVIYSANVKEVMGFSLSLLTSEDRDLVHPDDRAFVVEHFLRTLRGEANYDIEHRFVNPESGAIVWVHAAGLLVHDAFGNQSRFVGITRNITERKKAEHALAELHEQLEAELASVQRLHEVSIALQLEEDADKLLDSILDAAIELTGADKGNMQLLNSTTGELHIRSQRGFDQSFLQYFQTITLDTQSASAETLRSGVRTAVSDIHKSQIYSQRSLEMMAKADVQAVQSTPLVTRGGKLLGMLSTHWRQSHQMNERESRMMDLLARAAADLIERSQSEETLRQRAEEFKAHFNLTAVGNVQADSESGRFLLVNRAMCEITGYSEAELLERTIWEITDPQDRAENEQLFGEVVRGVRSSFELEKRFIRKDGEMRWGVVSVTVAQRDGEGRPLRTGSVVLDITRRKRAEEAMHKLNETLERRVEERTAQMRESEERFRALVDASAQIVWTMDSHGHVVEDSPSWREFTGQSFDEGKGWGWIDRVHPDDRERIIQNWRRSVATSVPMNTEFRICHRNGEWFWMQVRAVPLHNDAGTVRGWVGMNIDIHERKQAEADRERLARSLIMAEQEERRRISQVLHDDLQQLLYAAQMRIAMVGQDLQAAGQLGLLEEIEEVRNWLRQCIDTTRQMTVDLSPPILKNEGLADALEWLQPQMEQRHALKMVIVAPQAKQEKENPEDNSRDNFRIADEDLRALLFQIVRELLFNVAKHAGVDRVLVELGQERDHLVIHVVDKGVGFDMREVAERKKQKGGFGLFSVQERLRLVGGHMEVRSQPGAGTHVVIHAPVQVAGLGNGRGG